MCAEYNLNLTCYLKYIAVKHAIFIYFCKSVCLLDRKLRESFVFVIQLYLLSNSIVNICYHKVVFLN